MKKILLSAMALVATMSVNAQEFAPFTAADATRIGFVATTNAEGKEEYAKIEVKGGTMLCESESVVSTLAYDQAECGRTGLSKNDVTINGTGFASETGIQGNQNGPGSATEGEYPESAACMIHFTVKKNGYLYVFHKASANKNYVVFENKLRIPYIYSANDGGAYDLSKIDGATVVDPADPTFVTIADGYKIEQAQTIIGTDGLGGGTCVIKFPVYEGCEYDALATGSKITYAGFYFDETGDATIAAGDVTLLTAGGIGEGGETGISAVKPAENTNGAKYNLAGQQVDDTYKGVVIQNGKKSIQK